MSGRNVSSVRATLSFSVRAAGRQADVAALILQCERYGIEELTGICHRAAGKS